MNPQDIFVGLVAVSLGLYFCVSAMINSSWFTKFWVTRYLDQTMGSGFARGFGMILGIAFALLGVLLMLGMFSNKSGRQSGSGYPEPAPRSLDFSAH